MLKLRDPIKLHTTEPMRTGSDIIEQRILSNYQTMGAQLAPEDLLHLTTSPMEVFLQEGNMTSFVMDNRVTTTQHMKLELINNLVNRIALSDSAVLTYQDRVYITNLLQKLGVQDITSFMSSVHQMKSEQVQSQKLIEQYRNTVLEYVGRVDGEQRQPKTLPTNFISQEGDVNRQNWFLHQEIYRRLGTIENIYQMEQFTTGIEGESQQISRTQMLQSEYMRMANSLLLAEYRSYVTQEPHTPVTMGINPYELQSVVEEMTAQEITYQLSKSVLFHTVSQLFSSRIAHYMEGRQYHYDLSRALSQTAENSVRRFEQFHYEGRMLQASYNLQQISLNQLLQNESNLLNHYNGFAQYTADEQRYLEQNTEIWQGNSLNMTYLSQFSQEDLEEYLSQEHIHQEHPVTETTTITRDVDAPQGGIPAGGQSDPPRQLADRQVALTNLFRREMLRQERVQMQTQLVTHLNSLFQIVETMAYLKQQDTVQILALRSFHVSNEEWLTRQTNLVSSIAYAQRLEETFQTQQADFHFHETQIVEEGDSVTQNTEEQTSALTNYLAQINQENIRKREILQQTLQNVAPQLPKAVLPDLQKTKELAAMAIQSPGKLQEFLAKAESVDTTQPVNKQLEAILSVLDPVTRQLMERAIYRTQEPQFVSVDNRVQDSNLIQLMTDVTIAQSTAPDVPRPFTQQVETILHATNQETRQLVEELLERSIYHGVETEPGEEKQVTLTQLVAELTRLHATAVPGLPGVDGIPGLGGRDAVAMTHVTHETSVPTESTPAPGADGAPGSLMSQEHQMSHHTRETAVGTVLQRIYRDMASILPAQTMVRVIQQELMEYTNIHGTRQAFYQLEHHNELVYRQVATQYESVEQEQKERLVRILSEKTTLEQQRETIQTETLQLTHTTVTEQVSETISQTIADILYGTVSAVGPEYAETVVRQSVPMVLKRMETEIPEELTQLLETKNVTQVDKETFEVVKQDEKITTVVQPSKMEEEIKAHDEAEKVRKMVEQNIKSQVTAITDQVYQKLERRLQMERARRGK